MWCFDVIPHVYEKGYVWNLATCNYKNVKYLESIMDDSAITCDEIIESYDDETNFNEKKAICKMQNFYILLAFLLITIDKISSKTKTFKKTLNFSNDKLK